VYNISYLYYDEKLIYRQLKYNLNKRKWGDPREKLNVSENIKKINYR